MVQVGLMRKDFEALTERSFWEIGASGKRYSREYVLGTLEHRYKNINYKTWHIEDFQCQEIADKNYLVTYTLFQGVRQSRRSTIWRLNENTWKILFHQGTLVQ